MATELHAGYGRKGYLGRILVTLGSVALVADLDFLVQPLFPLAEKLGQGFFGFVPAVGLSFLNAARAFALHQVDYFSLISRILVLFTAMVAVIIGVALLRPPSARSTNDNHFRDSDFRGRETDNG
jgi:hypothetical protein